MCITGLHSLCSSPECVKVRNRASMTDLFLNSKPYNWINYSKLNDECHLIFWPTVMWAEINLFDVGLTSDFHVFMAEYWCSKVAPGSFFFTSSRVSAWWVVVKLYVVIALVSCPQCFRDWPAVRWLVMTGGGGRPLHALFVGSALVKQSNWEYYYTRNDVDGDR